MKQANFLAGLRAQYITRESVNKKLFNFMYKNIWKSVNKILKLENLFKRERAWSLESNALTLDVAPLSFPV